MGFKKIVVRFRWWLAGAMIILLAIWLLQGKKGPSTAGGVPLTAEVKRGSLTISVKASGSMRSTNPNKITLPPIKNRATIQYIVDEGTRVSNGVVLVRLQSEDLDKNVQQLETDVVECQSKYNKARTDLEIQITGNAAEMKKAERELNEARLELQRYYEGTFPSKQYEQDAAIQKAEAEMMKQKRIYQQYLDLNKRGLASNFETDEQKNKYNSALNDYESANLKKIDLEEYEFWIESAKKQGTLEEKQANLEKTRKQNEINLQSRQAEEEITRRNLEKKQSDLKSFKKEYECHVITATNSGVVVYGDPDFEWRRWYTRDLRVGGDVRGGMILMAIPDTTCMQAVVNVPEIDIQKIKIGQEATITVEALSGKVIHGKITNIKATANQSETEVKEYEVKISLIDSTGLKPDMSCDAEVIIEKVDSVLILPLQAIFKEGDNYVVYPARGGKIGVTVGKCSIKEAEISGDIREGTKVLLMPPESAKSEH